MRILLPVVTVSACLMCAGCTSPGGGGGGQPDLLSMCREMTGEFGTFAVDVKDEVVDRVLDETAGLTGR
ncbi:MAG: hypothetical protein WCP22_13400 [Chlamydiota bacterium]